MSLLASHRQPVEVPGIGRFHVLANDQVIAARLRQGQPWEPEVLQRLHAAAGAGVTLLELGANIGAHTVPAARWFERVIAVEPLFAEELRTNLQLNGIAHVEVVPAAIGHPRGRARMLRHDSNPGASHLSAGNGIEVEVKTLADVMPAGTVVLKLDIEGAEYLALRDADLSQVGLIVFECCERQLAQVSGATPEQLFAVLAHEGFREVRNAVDGSLVSPAELPRGAAFPNLFAYRGQGSRDKPSVDFRQTLPIRPAAVQTHANPLPFSGQRIEALTVVAADFAAAKARHQAGHLAEAERLYRAVLSQDEGHAHAWYLLGVARWQQGDGIEAEQCLRQALARRPDWAAAHNYLGIVLARRPRPVEAAQHFRAAVRLQPDLAEARHNLGLLLRQQGRADEARHCFQQAQQLRSTQPPSRPRDNVLIPRTALVGLVASGVVARDVPADSATAHDEHGLTLLAHGEVARAVSSFQQALRLQGDDAEVHHHLGLALLMHGRAEEAAAAFRQALVREPDHAAAHNNLALALHRHNHKDEALAHWRQAVHLEPLYPQAHNNLGLALLERGELAEAESSLREAVRLQADFAEAHNNLAVVLWRQSQAEKWPQALRHWRQALRLKPDYAEARHNLEHALLDHARLTGPEGRLREALRLDPGSAGVHNNLGVALLDQEDLAGAESSLREAIRLQVGFPEAHNNLSVVLWRQGRLEEAQAAALEALRLRPDFAEAHNNLGNVYHAQGRMDESLACFERSVELKPDYPDPHLNRALAWLLLGRWAEGWVEYEWRWQLRTVRRRTFQQPLWDGSPLEGRTIVLHAEQGLGDTLNFIRYAPLVQARGGRVVVVAPKPLIPLLSACRGIDHLAAFGESLPHFDVHAPLLTLPRLLQTTLDSVPTDVPYLHVDPERLRRWRLWLVAYQGFKVGIAWQGDRKHRNDRQRSAPLSDFAPLAQVPGVQLFSLQKGPGSEQLRDAPFAVTDLGNWLDNSGGAFLDTAAVMRNLDLVVCVDTALGHLAGGLGVPVWLALPFAPDWRWLRERPDTPWYPTMRLFRQPQAGDWPSVFADMAAELHRQVDTKSPAEREMDHPE